MKLFVLGATLSVVAYGGQLSVRVADGTGEPIWTRVEIRGPDGKMYQPEGAIRDTEKKARGGAPYYLGSFVIHGNATLKVPDGRFTIIAEHGLEYERGEKRVEVAGGQTVTVSFRLRPWIRMRDRGWWSGDVHIHRLLKDLPALAEAEDLNVSLLTNRNKQEMFHQPWPADPVIEGSPDRLILLTCAEDERRGGSWILDGLRKPLALARESGWFPPGIVYVRQARAQRPPEAVFPWFDLDMPIWWETPVMMALETPDSLDILHNQFMQYGIDQSEYWGRPRDRAKFPGWQGFVDYSLGLYYRYLNLGFRVPPTAGTGSGVMPSPPGYDRVYARIDGPLTVEKWFAAIRDGHSFVTNGPMLFFQTKKNGTKIEAAVEARAREPIDRCEIVANGEILKRFPVQPGKRQFRGTFTFDPRSHSWV
ncbi:MAG: hypothetical protein ACREH9_02135, partial [Pseudomonadota bacterium]